MLAYIIRRTLYAIPILIGVNLLTFWLFFVVNSPEDMARMQLGQKRVTAEAIEKWKQARGYDKPLLFNREAQGTKVLTNTIFFEKTVQLFVFDFGNADDGRNIAYDIRQRMIPSLALAIPCSSALIQSALISMGLPCRGVKVMPSRWASIQVSWVCSLPAMTKPSAGSTPMLYAVPAWYASITRAHGSSKYSLNDS